VVWKVIIEGKRVVAARWHKSLGHEPRSHNHGRLVEGWWHVE
jgi:hypothetical protein